MEKFVIEGGHRLSGTVEVSGSKNAGLALMAASLVCGSGVTVLNRIPNLRDTHTMIEAMGSLGVKTEFEINANRLKLDAQNITKLEAPYDIVKKMRASIYILGPLLGRFGEAKISFPGGCAFGPRPIDLHLEAMKSLGASIEIEEGYILARAKKGGRLNGGKFELKQISVGATGNMLMAAVLAKGGSLIKGAALEPEISTLINMLIKMGAKIKSTRKGGSAEIEVEGVHELVGVEETNTSDRIEAATLLAATAITGGKVSLTNVNIAELKAVIKNFKQAGCTMSVLPNLIRLESSNELFPVNVVAKPYPNFPTDMQAQWTALMTQSRGVSVIKDTVYLERFKHIPELNRLGAEITMNKNSAIVKGKKKLKGASVMSTDLRASACLVIAGLVASGKTEVLRVYHVDRGYERMEKKLLALGANIKREKYQEF